jgi:hypothetical protein
VNAVTFAGSTGSRGLMPGTHLQPGDKVLYGPDEKLRVVARAEHLKPSGAVFVTWAGEWAPGDTDGFALFSPEMDVLAPLPPDAAGGEVPCLAPSPDGIWNCHAPAVHVAGRLPHAAYEPRGVVAAWWRP